VTTHVRVLGVLHIAFSAIGLVFAIVLLLVLGGTVGLVGASGDADAQFAIPVIGITGMALVAVTIALSVPGLVVGIGLLKFRPWARILGIVLSIFDLIWVPLGTVIGAYGLFVLFSKESERLFAAPPTATAP
jgi:hypothetical protein